MKTHMTGAVLALLVGLLRWGPAGCTPQLGSGEPPEATPEDGGFFIPGTSDGGLTLDPRDAGSADAQARDSSSGPPADGGQADSSVGLDATGFVDAAPTEDAGSAGDAGWGARTFEVNAERSLVYVQVFKDPSATLASQSHDHVVRASVVSGTVTYNAEMPASCAVSLTVPVADLLNDEPTMRDLVGYSQNLSASDRATVGSHMRGADQLDEASFPTITFVSTACAGAPGVSGNLDVTGTLTIHGVGRSVTTTLEILTDGAQLRARGTFRAKQTDHGFSPYSAFFGAVRNLDDMTFTLDVLAER